MSPQSIQAQSNEVTQFATWLAGAVFLLWIGKTIGGMEKNFANSALDTFTPRELPVRIPQTKMVTVTCPVCGKVIEIPDYNSMTRSEALRQHLEQEHTSYVGWHPQVLIEGGESVPPAYSDITGLLKDPLSEYSLLVLLPAVEVDTGEKKIDAVMRQLKAGVEGIQDSYQFRIFLTTMSKFHDYSIGNQILIMLQSPDAKHVAGFNTWKNLGRWVKKGEKGIAILAPVMPPKPTCPRCGARISRGTRYCPRCGNEVEGEAASMETTPRFFRVVYVFALDQTEGKPLPEFDVPVLTGEADDELFTDLLIHMKQRSVSVDFDSRPNLDPEVKGFYSHAGIWVRPEEPRAQQLKTLLHEIAHYYSEGVFHIPRQDAETIAESAAFVVGAHFGFDTGVRSFPYVALWARDKKILENNLGAIRRVSTTIMDAIEEIRTRTLV